MLSLSQCPGLRKRAASSVIRDAESLPVSRIPDDRAVLPNSGIPGGPGVPGFRTRPFASGTRDAGNGRLERCGHPAPGHGTFSDSTRCADPRHGMLRNIMRRTCRGTMMPTRAAPIRAAGGGDAPRQHMGIVSWSGGAPRPGRGRRFAGVVARYEGPSAPPRGRNPGLRGVVAHHTGRNAEGV